MFLAIDSSDVDAVDILHESPCNFNEEYVMPLLQTINLKLRVVDLHDMSPEENFLQLVLSPSYASLLNNFFQDNLPFIFYNFTSLSIIKFHLIFRFFPS